MKNINKYFIVAIVLFVTGSMWCARTATTAEAPTRKITRRVAPTRKKPTRQQIAQQKTAAIDESTQDQNQADSVDSYDIKETKNSVIVSVRVPGFKLGDIVVEVIDTDYISISAGETKMTDETTMYYGGATTTVYAYNKTFPLPCPVNAKKMVKKVSNGILTITLPKL